MKTRSTREERTDAQADEFRVDGREQPDAGKLDRDGLVAVARWHREHERFHSLNALQEAAELRRNANALKVLAGRWLNSNTTEPPQFDANDPLYKAAGCEDLNDLAGVTTTGILFMEGESEPAELAQMKMRLAVLARGYGEISTWLAAKMEPAWERESVLLTTVSAAAAQPRFATLTRTTRAGLALGLIARLLRTAVSALSTKQFVPNVVRDDRPGSAQLFLSVSWLVDEASSILAEMAADLSRSDPDWTAYLGALDTIASSSTSG
jgi:hypothetical protein